MPKNESLKINKAYAEKYDKWRQKEELQKLKDKYGDDLDTDSDSSSSETEDEDAEALTDKLEKEWLSTLVALKKKDPKIYQKDFKFYHESENEDEDSSDSDRKKKKQKKEKPLYLKDYERKVLLEKGGIVSDSDDEEVEREMKNEADKKPNYYEEQEKIRQSFKATLETDSSDDEDILVERKKTMKEKEKEETEYKEWHKVQKKSKGSQAGIEMDSLQEYWQNPELDEGEKFIRDFILNKRYLDKEKDRVPTYEEVVDDGEGFSEEEDILEKQEKFERKYNFRYEEPDADVIKSFPRKVEDSVRQKDTKRAHKRQETKERKKMEKEQKKEELKQLKNLKRQEIIAKIEKLKEITGNQTIGFNEDDLEDDFDPKKHDEMMKRYFNEDYYELGAEEVKPEVGDDKDDALQIENWDNWQGMADEADNSEEKREDWEEGDTEPHVDDPDFIMDADYDPTKIPEKKKRKKSKFAEAVEASKPVFDPNEKSFEEYLDEYYKLDYEDIIGDIPCRFKYRKVQPNDFGLTVDEIFKCRDKELNAWVSLKKTCQYRTEEEEQRDVRIYRSKSKNLRKKLNILTSLRENKEKEETSANSDLPSSPIKERKRKKKNKLSEDLQKKQKLDNTSDAISVKNADDAKDEKEFQVNNSQDVVGGKKKKKKNKKKFVANFDAGKNDNSVKTSTNKEVSPNSNMSQRKKKHKMFKKHNQILSDERLKAYGINPKKFKYMKLDNFKHHDG
ncbi:hypothetical protein CHS0354_026477 [Potamilus streckersoni]|uniref:Protein KRI1 homolog n=1 Tax=Potamilus streckersoni TaxID=2493646 RepID=A0AAE0RQ63_9BIVA|nr:hypothetical protein CHS0354_026477 [Potamilus streckersoni]